MKVHLLCRNRRFLLRQAKLWNAEALTRDLALGKVFETMSGGDKFIFDVCETVLLSAAHTSDLQTIGHRQEILQDCLKYPSVVRHLYALAVEAMEIERKHHIGFLARYPNWLLSSAIELLELLLGSLRRLRTVADEYSSKFASPGWGHFFLRLQDDLSDDFFAQIKSDFSQLKFRDGLLLSAQLQVGNKASPYSLHLTPKLRYGVREWLKRQLFFKHNSAPAFSLHPRDESGAQALGEIRDRGISSVASALGHSAARVRDFFDALRTELAFYVGCLNLYDELRAIGAPVCFPSSGMPGGTALAFRELYDVMLSLNQRQPAVGNDLRANLCDLVMVTGANQGGKSTFLRGLGVAQLMTQAGMFVPATSFSSSLCTGIFTHYKREEDADMTSGKLDEELHRMSEIIDHVAPHAIILLNESFAATNEREGSEIALQIISALVEKRIRIVCVTHLYQLARGFFEYNKEDALFLRADRRADGSRTFKLVEGEPLQTSFGEDLYREVFRSDLRIESTPTMSS